jgi:peptidoglycan/xylan/chitin deacetylase (PgdA/CDA1 family)
VLAIIYNKVSRLPSEINNFLNEWEINEMLKSWIITIASHTNNHFDLRRLPIDKKTDEICKSKANLEGLFNISVNTIIYPSWKYDPDTLAISKKCNYTYWFTTGVKAVGIADLKSKPFELTRIRINRKTNLNAAMNFGWHTTSTWILSSAAK